MKHIRYRGQDQPSRRSYPAALEARLRPLRSAISVVEIDEPQLHGDSAFDTLGQPEPGCRCLVLDLRHVGALDEHAAAALQHLSQQLLASGVKLLIAGLAEGSAPARAVLARVSGMAIWPDADRAMEAAEQYLLGSLFAEAVAEVPLAESSLLRGLSPVQCQIVAARMQVRSLAAGESLFAAGDAADAMFVLTRGSICILSPATGGWSQRYLTMSPGMMLGETAMLDGGGRSATAVAEIGSVVQVLRLSALYALEREDPAIAIRLYHNIAHHLAQRLRVISAIWQAGAG